MRRSGLAHGVLEVPGGSFDEMTEDETEALQNLRDLASCYPRPTWCLTTRLALAAPWPDHSGRYHRARASRYPGGSLQLFSDAAVEPWRPVVDAVHAGHYEVMGTLVTAVITPQ